VQTSIQSRWQNGVAEWWVESCRRDLFDHIIALNECHLKRLLANYVRYYHDDRTHLGLRKHTRWQGSLSGTGSHSFLPGTRWPAPSVRPSSLIGGLRKWPFLGSERVVASFVHCCEKIRTCPNTSGSSRPRGATNFPLRMYRSQCGLEFGRIPTGRRSAGTPIREASLPPPPDSSETPSLVEQHCVVCLRVRHACLENRSFLSPNRKWPTRKARADFDRKRKRPDRF